MCCNDQLCMYVFHRYRYGAFCKVMLTLRTAVVYSLFEYLTGSNRMILFTSSHYFHVRRLCAEVADMSCVASSVFLFKPRVQYRSKEVGCLFAFTEITWPVDQPRPMRLAVVPKMQSPVITTKTALSTSLWSSSRLSIHPSFSLGQICCSCLKFIKRL